MNLVFTILNHHHPCGLRVTPSYDVTECRLGTKPPPLRLKLLYPLGPACDAVSISKICKDAQTLDAFPVSLLQLLLLYLLNRMA